MDTGSVPAESIREGVPAIAYHASRLAGQIPALCFPQGATSPPKGRCWMTSRKRFRSGDLCSKTDAYRFDGYLEAGSVNLPRLGELEVIVEAGQPFPRIESSQLDCWWMPAVESDVIDASIKPVELRMGS